MKMRLRAVSLLAAILMVLSACGRRGDDGAVSGSDTDPGSVFDLSEFTIIRPDEATQYEKNAAGAFRSLFEENTGVSLEIGVDYIRKGEEIPDAEPEILIGCTNRPQSAAAASECADNGYIIKMYGSKLVILGSNDFMTSVAVKEFFDSDVVGTEKTTVGSDLYISRSTDSLSLDLNEGQWTIVRSLNDGTKVAGAVSEMRKALEEVSGKDFKTVPDSRAPEEYEIIVGSAQRDEGAYVRSNLSSYGYEISVVDKKIVIAGANETCILKAIDRFITEIVGKGESEIASDLRVIKSDIYIESGEDSHTVTDSFDAGALDRLYAGKNLYIGDLHAHTSTGPNGDGSSSLAELRAQAQALGLDFVLCADHRQTTHVDSSDWDSGFYIAATEPGMWLKDENSAEFHYIIYAPSGSVLKQILSHYKTVYGYNGSTFSYPSMNTEDFRNLVEYVQSVGGNVTICHASQYFSADGRDVPDDPMYWYFGDGTLFEVLYANTGAAKIADNYRIWSGILLDGGKIYASGATDTHQVMYNNGSLNSVWADECVNEKLTESINSGLFSAGIANIRCAVGDTLMGGTARYTGDGQQFIFSVSDVKMCSSSEYRIRVYTDMGIAFDRVVKSSEVNMFAIELRERGFYRVEVSSKDGSTVYALGQPIWIS